MTILSAAWFWPVIMGVASLLIIVLVLFALYKVAEPNRALVITGFGCKEPKVRVSGGAFVIPILQKAKLFPLDIMTITEAGDEVRTNKAVPIVIKWTAQVSVQTDDSAKLAKTIRLFIDRGASGIQESVKYTIQANVRETIASMTPEDVLTNKKEFVVNIVTATKPDLDELGLRLSTLNINDVCDNIGYYDNMAAAQTEEKRREAEIARATTEQEIREKRASTDQQAQEAELAADLAVAEKRRDNDVKKAGFKVETERAQADADMAGAIQTQERQAELNAREGDAKVVATEKENAVAKKQNEVAETEAARLIIETKGQADAAAAKLQIDTDATAKAAAIEADGKAKAIKISADGEAEAIKRKADGAAEAVKLEAGGNAEAVKLEAAAEQARITQVGTADAEIIKQKGLAEAEAIEAQGRAKATAELEMANALAANESVNFRVQELKIEANAKVEIATNVAKVMAEVGTNAKFVHIGGDSSGSDKTGNILLDTLAGIPEMLMKANVRSDAMNDGNTMPLDLNSIINGLRKSSGDGDAESAGKTDDN
ncbi:MAG: SPFH domain-containing protein [Defluviitaleaceae bacterium]|nr:SPFH domain-containing protein [Defluviitaleaceae bacterium]